MPLAVVRGPKYRDTEFYTWLLCEDVFGPPKQDP
jgi:hypothetical protein